MVLAFAGTLGGAGVVYGVIAADRGAILLGFLIAAGGVLRLVDTLLARREG